MYVAAVNKINKSDLMKRECGREGKKTMVLRAQNTHCTRVYSFRQKRKCLCALTHTHGHGQTSMHTFPFYIQILFLFTFLQLLGSLSLSLWWKRFSKFSYENYVCVPLFCGFACASGVSHIMCVSLFLSPYTLSHTCAPIYIRV